MPLLPEANVEVAPPRRAAVPAPVFGERVPVPVFASLGCELKSQRVMMAACEVAAIAARARREMVVFMVVVPFVPIQSIGKSIV